MTALHLKEQVLRVLGVWEQWSLYPPAFLQHLEAAFLKVDKPAAAAAATAAATTTTTAAATTAAATAATQTNKPGAPASPHAATATTPPATTSGPTPTDVDGVALTADEMALLDSQRKRARNEVTVSPTTTTTTTTATTPVDATVPCEPSAKKQRLSGDGAAVITEASKGDGDGGDGGGSE
eukprot:TRINITY_DN2493_c0_g3_i3.p2 TRINITY_DN2493_c0_g3~~TRINITY_DN2493_c0_g3_i3.p2  ORF type:complete len:181 (-),score=77.86 TRINITY_DN2493_c0_g3_i3:55-597(-)